jgi:hypothetical protein
MTLACMGSAFQHRLSFSRVLLRRMARQHWQVTRPTWELDAKGYGAAVYTVRAPHHTYSLVVFSQHLDPDKRTDRVIAAEWDATFALFDGAPTPADIERLAANVPRQEAGRITRQELSLARANRSIRMFDYVVDCLSAGEQPAPEKIAAVGYLMRTTAVYGSGKMGAADFEAISDRDELKAPYQAEMLAVYLIREFTLDLVEHIARCRAPATAVPLAPALRRRFGVGNATGLGMAPYMANHPVVLNQWLLVRETALARVRCLASREPAAWSRFNALLKRATIEIEEWQTSDETQRRRIAELRQDWASLAETCSRLAGNQQQPWDWLYRTAAATLHSEARELLVSLLLECNGPLIDDLEDLYKADEAKAFRIDGTRTVASTLATIDRNYTWAFAYDFSRPEENARFWYASVEKLEPRLGERATEEGAEREFPLAIARNVQELRNALQARAPDEKLAAFLLQHPEHRHTLRRVQLSETHPYAEICDNTISAAMRPIDLLRFKLAFFGCSRFDPRSDRWVRITMFQNAPFARQLTAETADDWLMPEVL